MVKPGTVVLLPATLTGMGHTAQCGVLARKLAMAGSGAGTQFVYTYCSIVGAPDELPDGPYLVHFDGFTVKASCSRGEWLPRGLPVRDPIFLPLAS